MEQVTQSNIPDSLKKIAIKRIAAISTCCTCSGIPFYQVVTQLEGASRIEIYCKDCYAKREEQESQYGDPSQYMRILPRDQWPDKLAKMEKLGFNREGKFIGYRLDDT